MLGIFYKNILKISVIVAFMAIQCQSRQGGLSTDMHDKKVVCYWGTWSHYRPKDGEFRVEHLDPSLCTHLIYSFAGLTDNKIVSLDPWLDLGDSSPGSGLKNFENVVGLKRLNPSLKVTIAIGGWNQGSEKYSEMAKDASTRKIFVHSVVEFLQEHGFDGLDLDWEYPAKRGGKDYDKKNFVLLIKDLKEAFEPHGFIVTAAIGAGEETIKKSYDIPEMYKYLDLIHVMCYDYHGKWDKTTGHNAPLYAKPDASGNDLTLTIDHTWKVLKELGATPDKTVLGVPFYGRTYNLVNPHDHRIGARIAGGFEGPYTRESGFMGYNEICEELNGFKKSEWTVERDEDIKAPFMYGGKKWVCFDDVQSIKEKVNFAMDQSMAGIMIWSVDTDDFRGKCGPKYPLLTAINEALVNYDGSSGAVTPRPSFTTNFVVILAISFAIHQLVRF